MQLYGALRIAIPCQIYLPLCNTEIVGQDSKPNLPMPPRELVVCCKGSRHEFVASFWILLFALTTLPLSGRQGV
jgi:hypothetical protein